MGSLEAVMHASAHEGQGQSDLHSMSEFWTGRRSSDQPVPIPHIVHRPSGVGADAPLAHPLGDTTWGMSAFEIVEQKLTIDHVLWLPELRGLTHQEQEELDDDGDEDEYEEDEEDEASPAGPAGPWDGAIAQAEAAGYAREGFPLLMPTLAGAGGEWSRVMEEAEWSVPFDNAVGWIDDAVYTRAKAWCGESRPAIHVDADTRDRTIRWPDLATANYLINSEQLENRGS